MTSERGGILKLNLLKLFLDMVSRSPADNIATRVAHMFSRRRDAREVTFFSLAKCVDENRPN